MPDCSTLLFETSGCVKVGSVIIFVLVSSLWQQFWLFTGSGPERVGCF